MATLLIHVASVSASYDQNDYPLVFNAANQTIAAHPIFLKASRLRASQYFANASRVIKFRKPFVNESQNPPSYLRVKLAEFALSSAF